MADKYEQMRSDINKMKTSYGNRFPMTFYPDTILELLDELADLAALNEEYRLKMETLKEKQDADAGREQRQGRKKVQRVASEPTGQQDESKGGSGNDS